MTSPMGFDWISGDVEDDRARRSRTSRFRIWDGTRWMQCARMQFSTGIALGPDGLHAYFVHSYHLVPDDPEDVIALTDPWRTDHRDCRTRQHGGHAVSSREEPAAWPEPDRQFPAVAALILFPAIDLKDGQCVRLKLGDMNAATVFNDDPAAQAVHFASQGFQWLHLVDLNGAFAGKAGQ